mmetsp:Transcript_10665/g.37196  ORF Transcript_10665/g.37196 Transcript_10665/m.37196 type:complete len:83 (-) Transcript_10665:1912-2160(-)
MTGRLGGACRSIGVCNGRRKEWHTRHLCCLTNAHGCLRAVLDLLPFCEEAAFKRFHNLWWPKESSQTSLDGFANILVTRVAA